MLPLPSPEHVQFLSMSRLEAACGADDAPETDDDARLLARLARAERARRLGLYTALRETHLRTPVARDRTKAAPRLGEPRAEA